MNKNEDNLLKLYNLAEITYEKTMKKFGFKEEILYPDNWHTIKNYKEKIEIIGEAIKANNLIINTTKYQELIIDKKSKRYVKE